jgi:dihydrofolate reductase
MLQIVAACNSSNDRIVATISNKSALTAEWIAEDNDRSLELTFNPSSYNADNIETVVSSSDSNVVLVSGTKLSAIGPGTATISVAVEGTITDSVEISVKARQTGIVISNLQEVSSIWTLGEADRTLEVAKVYKKADSVPLTSAEVNVTSSNPEAVSVSGLTLSAQAAGKSTITVRAGDFETSVEVTVKLPLQSFSIENTSELATVLCGMTYEMQPFFTPAETYTKDNTTPTVEFGTEGILSYEGGYKFKAISVGSTSVKVTVEQKTVEFNVAVEIGVPTLDIIWDDNFNAETRTYNVVLQTGEQTKTIELPQVTARNGEGNDISDTIVVDTTITVTDGTATLGAGTYTIKYSVTDSRDTEKSASETLTINVLDSTFAINPTYSDGTRMFAESVDENGKVSATPAHFAYSERDAMFNIEASTLYYAEATFTYNVTKDWPVIGLAHFNALNTTIADGDAYNNAGALLGRRCIESVMTNNGKFIIKDLKPTDDHWYENYASDNIYLNSSFKANSTFTSMTIAIARTADKMYTFVDGVLISEYDVPADYSGATTPGIISCGARYDFTVSEISVLIGTTANEKIVEMVLQSATATISNKSALNELWTVGGADRNVVVAYSSSLINAGNTTTVIESSDVSVISVNGNTIKAVGEGTATIKLLLNGKLVDSIELTVYPASVKSLFGNNPTLSDGSKLYTETADASGNITVSSDKNGEFAATFDMEASTLYYAEATFYVIDTSNAGDYPAFGLAHFTALNTSVNETGDVYSNAGSRLGRVCVASIKSGSSATFLIGNLTASDQMWYNAASLYKNTSFQANNFTQMTVAIARTADTLYTFVNGVLVQAVAAPDGYNNVATTPGIITICNANQFTANNIQLLSGEDAQAKITELTATNA